MKRSILFLLGIFAHTLSAQTQRPVLLAESLNLALQNSAQLKKANIDRKILDQRFKEARSAGMPQIHANVSFDYFPILPTQLLPGELFGQAEGTYIPTQFGRPWQLTGGVAAEQILYDEQARRGIPAMNVSRSVYDLLIERSEEEVIFNTSTVFYQILQTEQLLYSVNANLEKLDALQRMAELQLANGYAIPIDVKRIRVARTNLETQRENLLAAITALRQTLQFLCGISFDAPFQATEDVSNPTADSTRWQSLTLEAESTTEYRLLLRNIELNRVQTNALRAAGSPTLSAYAGVSLQNQSLTPNVLSFSNRWFSMAMLGVKMHIPIFDGFKAHRHVGLLALENQKLDEDGRQLLGAKNLEFRQARAQLQNALRGMRTQTENVALAREITDKLMLQYKEGALPLTDLLNAQTALAEAQTNYWQQFFTYKLAVLKLLKSTGHLKDLRG